MNIILFPSLLETTAVNRLRDEFQCEFSRPWEAGLREWGYGHRTGGEGLGAPGLLHAQRKLRGPRDTAGEARARGSSPSRWLRHATPAGWPEPWAPGPRAGRPQAQRGACPRRPPPAGRAMGALPSPELYYVVKTPARRVNRGGEGEAARRRSPRTAGSSPARHSGAPNFCGRTESVRTRK